MTNILDKFPELKGGRVVDERAYRMVITENKTISDYDTENIALAFALSQLRSEQRREQLPKRRRWKRRKSHKQQEGQ